MKDSYLIFGLILGLVLVTSGCVDNPDYESSDAPEDQPENTSEVDNEDDTSTEEETVEEVLDIEEHNLVRDGSGMAESVSVEGTATHVGDEALSYAEIRVRFYDSEGNLVESFIDNINDLEPGQSWAFEVMYPGIGEDAAEIDDYDIAVGSSF